MTLTREEFRTRLAKIGMTAASFAAEIEEDPRQYQQKTQVGDDGARAPKKRDEILLRYFEAHRAAEENMPKLPAQVGDYVELGQDGCFGIVIEKNNALARVATYGGKVAVVPGSIKRVIHRVNHE